MTFDCTSAMQATSPAVCHVDGTARPQLIRERDNPEYHAILAEYHAMTGIPSLVNTSFNIHDEPIVCTAADAVRAFLQSRLDALVLGDLVILAPASDSAAARRFMDPRRRDARVSAGSNLESLT
jgi:carbamoyltransferase